MPTMASILIAVAARAALPAAAPTPPTLQPVVVRAAHEPTPAVRVWLGGDHVYRRGEHARVYFRTDEAAYVLVVRIDTDGRMRVLYPAYTTDYVMARPDRTYRVPGPGHDTFVVDDETGMGYVFALASWDPFDLDRIATSRGGAYHYAGLRRVYSDPFVAVQEFAEDLLDRDAEYTLDYVEYHVERRVAYPRFLCYDCHAHRRYPVWDPYGHRCRVYRVVIYNDPYYYPYRVYRGSRVVYTRRPRYEFKTASRGSGRGDSEPFIEYRRLPDDVDRRRPGSPTADPNLPPRGRDARPGATRPGDEVAVGGSGRRRVRTHADEGAPAPIGPEAQPPRQEPPRAGEDGDAQPADGRPRRDPPRQNDPRQADPPRPDDPPRTDGAERAPVGASRPVPRPVPRGEPRWEARPNDGWERRPEPRSGSDERRAEPRVEPRSAPREERRAEPARSSGGERREGGSDSRPSRSGDGESGRRRAPPR